MEEAWEALQGAIEAMEETAGGVGAVKEAMHAAEKHDGRSEKLAALVEEARELIEQARAAAAPAPNPEETLCVVCMDAPKDHIVLPSCTCACVRRAPSCSATAARCVAGPSSKSRRCSPESALA
jgi:hypothetical protein